MSEVEAPETENLDGKYESIPIDKFESTVPAPEEILSGTTTEVQDAIAKFFAEFKERSYSGRHPELGKMVNCAICGTRHRASQVCEQKFKEGTGPVEPKHRHGLWLKKLMNPHFSRYSLQVVDLTRQLLPYYT